MVWFHNAVPGLLESESAGFGCFSTGGSRFLHCRNLYGMNPDGPGETVIASKHVEAHATDLLEDVFEP